MCSPSYWRVDLDVKMLAVVEAAKLWHAQRPNMAPHSKVLIYTFSILRGQKLSIDKIDANLANFWVYYVDAKPTSPVQLVVK